MMTTMAPFSSRASFVGEQTDWSYDVAFSRNLGLISAAEQDTLRQTTIAIAGMGGVGGVHLMTLARLGIGGFQIADPDRFEAANFNRQYGALVANLGQPKAEVMAEYARQVNPDVRLKLFPEHIDAHNIAEFLAGADIYIDGVDFFSFSARRMIFAEARRRGLWAITAGPLGFSTAWLVFDPRGMSFDEYFDLRDDMTGVEQTAAMAVGLCPAGTHLPYLDLKQVDLKTGRGPSAGLACQLCAGVAAAEVLKIRLGRGQVRPAPYYFQFDAYRQTFRRGRLWWGNRHPLQRLKRTLLARRLKAAGVE
jgi:molybdopterin/thiamine biosynthesis adenylyltransferase